MKKLRIIITAVIVLAIVGGAFAFKTKSAVLCVRTGGPGICTTWKQGIRLTTNTSAVQYWAWPDASTAQICTHDVDGRCTVTARLTPN